jgi:hypothetical protein
MPQEITIKNIEIKQTIPNIRLYSKPLFANDNPNLNSNKIKPTQREEIKEILNRIKHLIKLFFYFFLKQ